MTPWKPSSPRRSPRYELRRRQLYHRGWTTTAGFGLGPDDSLKTPDADRSSCGSATCSQLAATDSPWTPRRADPRKYRVTIPPSTRPAYLKGPKGKGEAELWCASATPRGVFEVADAVQYVVLRAVRIVHVSAADPASV